MKPNISLEDLFKPDPVEPIEDISLDEPPKDIAKYPFAKKDLICPECSGKLVIRTSTKYRRPFYGCENFPQCRGSHGAYPDGRPLGVPGDKATKAARVRAHTIFDQLWKSRAEAGRGLMTRAQAYAWMRTKLNLSGDQAHISNLNLEQCNHLITCVYVMYPEVRTAWDRLLMDEGLFDEPEEIASFED